MQMAQTVSLSFRVPAKKARAVEKLAKATDRPKSWLLEQALDAYLDTQAWQIKQIKQGLAELRRGESVPHEEILKWLSTRASATKNDPPR
jgi:predicted transcriptional regulator